MSNFDFGGYKPKYTLFNQKLTLDPDIERMISLANLHLSSPDVLENWLRPDFSKLMLRWSMLLQPLPAPGQNPWYKPDPTEPSGSLPDADPRPGQLSDFTGALFKLPAVQQITTRLNDEAQRQLALFGKDWAASNANKVAIISVSGMIIGPLLYTAAFRNTDGTALALLKNKDIPIPLKLGDDYLSFKIMDRGYGATVPIPGVSGLSVSGHYSAPENKSTDYGFSLSLDVTKLFKVLK